MGGLGLRGKGERKKRGRRIGGGGRGDVKREDLCARICVWWVDWDVWVIIACLSTSTDLVAEDILHHFGLGARY